MCPRYFFSGRNILGGYRFSHYHTIIAHNNIINHTGLRQYQYILSQSCASGQSRLTHHSRTSSNTHIMGDDRQITDQNIITYDGISECSSLHHRIITNTDIFAYDGMPNSVKTSGFSLIQIVQKTVRTYSRT